MQIEKRKIDIELKIDGTICDPKAFFDVLYSQYSEQVIDEAKKIVKEKMSDKFAEISDKLEIYRQITEDWANDINWDAKNPLTLPLK